MRRVHRLAILLLLLGGAFFVWRAWFQGPEQQIRQRMMDLQQLISFQTSQSQLGVLANLRQLRSLLTEEAWIRVDVPGGPRGVLTGRENILQALAGAREAAGDIQVEFLDLVVTLSGDRREAMVETTGKARQMGSDELWIQELRFYFVRTAEGWQISSVETVRTLTQTVTVPSWS